MKRQILFAFLCLIIAAGVFAVNAQEKIYTDAENAKVDKLFDEANLLAEEGDHLKALLKYDEAIAIIPDSPGLLYNGGLAAFQTKNFEKAQKYWSKLKQLDDTDWQVKTKLIQTYQALGKFPERDAERKELFDLRKSGKLIELYNAEFYCREQSVLSGRKVMIFEHFELTGDRALRYVFHILNDEEKSEFRISLGSYSFTNSIWRETTKPKPKDGERLFHLDGYYDWGHSTYGMYTTEPTYEATRKIVEGILAKENKPISSSVINQPRKDTVKTEEKTETKPN